MSVVYFVIQQTMYFGDPPSYCSNRQCILSEAVINIAMEGIKVMGAFVEFFINIFQDRMSGQKVYY